MENNQQKPPQNNINNVKFIFGDKKENYNSKIEAILDPSTEKVKKNTEKYLQPLKLKNEKCFFVIKFKLKNPENDEKITQKQFAEFQKLIKNLFITLKALNKQAKEYIKNFTLSFAHIKNHFCVGVTLSQTWEDMIFAAYEGIQMASNIELGELSKQMQFRIMFEKGINETITKPENITTQTLLNLLDNFIIQWSLAISMKEVLEILKKTPINYEKYEDLLYHPLYILKKMKNSNLEMEFDNLNHQDYEEIFNVYGDQLGDIWEPKQLPWKINILPKILDLFHSAFESKVQVLSNVKDVSTKINISTDGIHEAINKIIKI